MREKAAQASVAESAGKPLTEEQHRAQRLWADELKQIQPTATGITQEIRYHLGSYWEGFAYRTKHAGILFGLFGFPYESLGMMLIGMGLLKMGVFSAERSYCEYALMAVLGFGFGLSSAGYIGWRNVRNNFSPGEFFSATCCGHVTSPTYDLERLSAGLGFVALVMLIVKAGLFRRLTSWLAAAGRMALTNYLMQTVTCVLLFDGLGLGLYGRFQHLQLIFYVLLPMWAFQLAFSAVWLRYFRFGPIEWLWRSLTYWKLQPMHASFSESATTAQSVVSDQPALYRASADGMQGN